jgi:SAM-dependent methyltransferase
MSSVFKMPKKDAAPRDARIIRIMVDKPRTLMLDYNAVSLIEEATGKNVFSGDFIPRSIIEIRKFLWACLQTAAEGDESIPAEGPITEEELGSWLYKEHVEEAMQICVRLLANLEDDPITLAPFVPSDHGLIEAALTLAAVKPGETLYDLGCGDGRVMAVAGSKYGAKVRGIERDASRAKVARSLMKAMEFTDAKVIEGTIQENAEHWTKADVVFIYLLVKSNTKLKPEFEKMKPGARIVSHDFPINGWTPSAVTSFVGPDRTHSIYCYEIGKHVIEEKPLLDDAGVVTDDAAANIADVLKKSIETAASADETATRQ